MKRTVFSVLAAATSLSLPLFAGGGDLVGTNFCVCHPGMPEPCAIPNSEAGCTNSTGEGGLLSGHGSANVLLDDLTLVVSNISPGAFGIVFLGGAEITVPFGDGIRCIDPGPPAFNRFLVKQADATGSFTEGPGIVDFSQTWFPMNAQIVGGMTFKFQGWYRDHGTPCASSFNFTNGLSVTFNLGGELTEFDGLVFYDFNENGVYDELDPNEIPIPGWRIDLGQFGGGTEGVVFTGDDGRYSAAVDRDSSTYDIISNAPPPGFVGVAGARWAATTPNPVSGDADVAQRTNDFGVVFYTNENSDELLLDTGFWRTSEGEALLLVCDPTWRTVINNLCLRTNEANEEAFFTVPLPPAIFEEAYTLLTDYLNGPDIQHIGNQLSREVALAHLNVTCGPLAEQSLCIDAEGDGILVEFEDLSEGTVALLCEPCAAETLVLDPLQEAHDHCSNALDLGTGNAPVFTDTTFATIADPPDGCVGNAPNLWFEWTASGEGMVTIHTCDSFSESQVGVYTSCDVNDVVECFGDPCGLGSILTLPVTCGETLLIEFVSQNPMMTAGALLIIDETVTTPCPPMEDNCSTPLVLPAGDISVTTDTTNATFGNPIDGCSGSAPNVWFEWTASGDGSATIETCDSDYVSQIGIYSSCDVGDVIDCFGSPCGMGAILNIPVTCGETYLIEVVSQDFNPTIGGMATLSIFEYVTPCPPSNDDCATPEVLPPGDTSVMTDTTNATIANPVDGCTGVQPTIWYEWTATGDGTATFDTCAFSDYDNRISVYSSCDTGDLIMCSNNDFCAPLGGDSMTIPVACQETYLICIEGGGVFSPISGLATLTITESVTPCPPEDCLADVQNCLNEWEGVNSNGNMVYVKSASPPVGLFDTPYSSTFDGGTNN